MNIKPFWCNTQLQEIKASIPTSLSVGGHRSNLSKRSSFRRPKQEHLTRTKASTMEGVNSFHVTAGNVVSTVHTPLEGATNSVTLLKKNTRMLPSTILWVVTPNSSSAATVTRRTTTSIASDKLGASQSHRKHVRTISNYVIHQFTVILFLLPH